MKTRKVDVLIKNQHTEKEVYRKDGFEIPENWSDHAATIVANKYSTDAEMSVMEIIDRVVIQIAEWGLEQGYFSEEGKKWKDTDGGVECQDFIADLKDILINQRASFNSPVWFNCGVPENNNQMSACFIFPVEDNMEDILQHTVREGMVFKSGSGSGVNVSKLRAKGEKLSNKGEASGPLSFMKMWDACAGSVKSGGKTRRSAKLVCLNVDHPDIIEFIECKKHEEEKAKILIAAGVDPEEAYQTVFFQNANHSIRVNDRFMRLIGKDGPWFLTPRGEKEIENAELVRRGYMKNPGDILRKAAEIAWETGDPGIQFDDQMNKDNPVPSLGKINSTNPCQPGFATVFTPEGIRTFNDISVGSTIWSGKRMTKVTHKVNTGTKKVFRYQTTAGYFVGTDTHRVLQNGEKIEVREAETIDRSQGPNLLSYDRPEAQDIIDGWVLGDGSVHKASDNLVYLILGANDESVFLENFKDYVIRPRPGLKPGSWEVMTTITSDEIPYTYERKVPERFKKGNRDKIIGFLMGLYAANGSICGDRITLKASSFDIISDVQEMLSTLNIASYFTTNKSKKVTFSNGTYECKQSYDLNITVDRHPFRGMIGFLHPHKKQALDDVISRLKKSCKSPKQTYEIIKTEELGEFPVWDIRVDADEHTYWSGGLLVSNCSEFSAVDNSSCNLASLNLVKYLNDDGELDHDLFKADIATMITAMDILIDAADYPTPEVREMTTKTRPLGLGFTNLGAYLMLQGKPYDSPEARHEAAFITRLMTSCAYRQSTLLAKRLGSFAAFEENMQRCIDVARKLVHADHDPWDDEIAMAIREKGLRNSQLTLLAPTGTISFMMDADTTGIEPLFALKSIKTLAGGGTMDIIPGCVEKAWQKHCSPADEGKCFKLLQHGVDVSEEYRAIFRTANEIHWKDHILMMAACQKHLNGAISKTVNMPADCTVEDIIEAYQFAWENGLKALAVYRDSSKGMQPLQATVEDVEEEDFEDEGPVWSPVRRKLPDTRRTITHKFNIGGIEGFIQPGMYDDDALGEVFLRVQKQGSTINGLMDAFAIMTSLALQYGVPLEAMAEKLTQTRFEPQGFTTNEDIRICTSLMDYIFRWLTLEFGDEDEEISDEDTGLQSIVPKENKEIDASGPTCSTCGGMTTRSGTCYLCRSCGTTTGCS